MTPADAGRERCAECGAVKKCNCPLHRFADAYPEVLWVIAILMMTAVITGFIQGLE